MDAYRVTAPHYVAGFEVEDNVVVKAAPILHWAMRQRATRVIAYLCQKKYRVELVSRGAVAVVEPRNCCND